MGALGYMPRCIALRVHSFSYTSWRLFLLLFGRVIDWDDDKMRDRREFLPNIGAG